MQKEAGEASGVFLIARRYGDFPHCKQMHLESVSAETFSVWCPLLNYRYMIF